MLQRLSLILMLLAASAVAQAQSWPAKPIRFIVPTPAGTSPDNIGRILADKLLRVLG